MRKALCGLFSCLLAACGPDETRFVPDFADEYCRLVMECEDPAVLTFDGLSDHEDCLAIYGPAVESMGSGCEYRARKARRCLRRVAEAACPEGGAPVEAALPAECDEVYVNCTDADPERSPTSPEDTGT